MSRYIDAEWLMKYFKRGKEYKGAYVLDDLKYDAPSIDIVRCGECKYRHTCCRPCYKADDSYCSDGERDSEKPNNSKERSSE